MAKYPYYAHSLTAADCLTSVVGTHNPGGKSRIAYAPFGHSTATSNAHSAFVGQWLECKGTYMLGNGRRMYFPTLMRFSRPDSYSPFGEGGLNAYAYCTGQPVSQSDPTGTSPMKSLFALGAIQTTMFSVLTITTAFAADAEPVTTALGITTGVFALGTFGIGARLARASRRTRNIVPTLERGISRDIVAASESRMARLKDVRRMPPVNPRMGERYWNAVSRRRELLRQQRPASPVVSESSISLRVPVQGPSHPLPGVQQRPPLPVIIFPRRRMPSQSSSDSGVFDDWV